MSFSRRVLIHRIRLSCVCPSQTCKPRASVGILKFPSTHPFTFCRAWPRERIPPCRPIRVPLRPFRHPSAIRHGWPTAPVQTPRADVKCRRRQRFRRPPTSHVPRPHTRPASLHATMRPTIPVATPTREPACTDTVKCRWSASGQCCSYEHLPLDPRNSTTTTRRRR